MIPNTLDGRTARKRKIAGGIDLKVKIRRQVLSTENLKCLSETLVLRKYIGYIGYEVGYLRVLSSGVQYENALFGSYEIINDI